MIQNKILTLNWCFIVINDVKNIIESFALLFLLRSLQISFSIFFVWVYVRSKITTTSISWASIYRTTIMRSLNICESSTVTSKVFDTLFNCIRLDVSNWWIDRWEFVSTLVDVYEYNDDTKINFFLLNYIIVVCCWVIRVVERVNLEVWSSFVSIVLERI